MTFGEGSIKEMKIYVALKCAECAIHLQRYKQAYERYREVHFFASNSDMFDGSYHSPYIFYPQPKLSKTIILFSKVQTWQTHTLYNRSQKFLWLPYSMHKTSAKSEFPKKCCYRICSDLDYFVQHPMWSHFLQALESDWGDPYMCFKFFIRWYAALLHIWEKHFMMKSKTLVVWLFSFETV